MEILGSKRGIWQVIAGVMAGVVIFALLAMSVEGFRPDEVGLGLNTSGKVGFLNGKVVSGLPTNLNEVLNTYVETKKSKRPVALWIGASQLHSINYLKKGDLLAVEYANLSADSRSSKFTYIQASHPNASFYDILVMYLYFRETGYSPDWIIIPIVYNNLRETNIKPDIIKLLQKIEKLDHDEGSVIYLRAEKARSLEDEQAMAVIERQTNKNVPQYQIEKELVNLLEKAWPAFRQRGNVVAKAETIIRSMVTRVTGNFMEKRTPPVQDVQKNWNMGALKTLVGIATEDKTKILFYRQPHRPDQKVFYHDRRAYDGYFNEVQIFCEKEGIYYADLEMIVPAQYYGRTNEGREDVFHFQDYGHRQLGIAVDNLISSYERR